MRAATTFLLLVVTTTWGFPAWGQTIGNMLRGAKTFYIDLTNAGAPKCGYSKEDARRAVSLPLNYATLKEVESADSSKAEIWNAINVFANKRSKGKFCCGRARIYVKNMLWGSKIVYNEKKHDAEIPLWSAGTIFFYPSTISTRMDRALEKLMEDFVTDYNSDNK